MIFSPSCCCPLLDIVAIRPKAFAMAPGTGPLQLSVTVPTRSAVVTCACKTDTTVDTTNSAMATRMERQWTSRVFLLLLAVKSLDMNRSLSLEFAI